MRHTIYSETQHVIQADAKRTPNLIGMHLNVWGSYQVMLLLTEAFPRGISKQTVPLLVPCAAADRLGCRFRALVTF